MEGYTGKILDMDLGSGQGRTRDLPEKLLKKFVGGRGLAARLLYELLPPGIDPLSPANLLVIGTGPLTGTMTPGPSKHIIVTRSPATGGFVDSYSSGRVGVELRAAGFDCLVVGGKANKPSILIIDDQKVELCDAADLWGKDAFSAEEELHKRFGPEFSYMVIGPAGENLVRYACVNSEFYRQAGRGGVGAVFGSKMLKAVLIRGTGSIPCKDPRRIVEMTRTRVALARGNDLNKSRMQQGTPGTMNITNSAGMLPTRNFSRGTFPEGTGKLDGDGVGATSIATRACFGCFTPCSKIGKFEVGSVFKGNTVEGPEYETVSLLGSNLEVSSLPFVLHANFLCDRLGLDTISTGVVLGFVMECCERGLLTREQLDGLEPRFGEKKDCLELIRKIAYREGCGDFMAEGVKRMAEVIGKGSEHFAMHSKGMEMPGYDPRGAYGCALTFAVNPRGACHRRAWPPLELFSGADPWTVDGKAAMIKATYDDQIILHLLLVCDFPASAIPMAMNEYVDYLNAATGWEIDMDELYLAAERAETQIRLFNIREGMGRKDDRLPGRIITEPLPDGPGKGRIIGQEAFDLMLSEYYAMRGWDDEGAPTPATLKKLGLD